ncbi:hypothetical protein ACL598_16740 [Bordetella bronchialis]|uniref:hypothetical protein n=1 Tax=Bordetella bronchialis TaxID=463025 RepID=UPI003D07A7BB
MGLLAVLSRPLVLIAAGALMVLALAGGGWWLHHDGYAQGRADEKQAALIAQQALAEAMQQEKDRADAKYRGAVLARQQAERQLADAQAGIAASRARIDGLLQQLRNKSKAAAAGGRPDGPGPDWIGIFGECVARVESLTERLGQVGADAARFADQVNGLQGYVRALQPSK